EAAAAKPAAKGPGKKQLALIQEALRLQREEEERLQREEEERIRREEEAELARLERLRIEQERKEKKKQKEKERKERLKKEGKLLNPKRKASQERAKPCLQVATETGQVVVASGTGAPTATNPKYEMQKSNNATKQTSVEQKPSDESPEVSEPIEDDPDEDDVE